MESKMETGCLRCDSGGDNVPDKTILGWLKRMRKQSRMKRALRWTAGALCAAFLCLGGIVDRGIPDIISVRTGEEAAGWISLPFVELEFLPAAAPVSADPARQALVQTAEARAMFCGLPIKRVSVTICDPVQLCPGGMQFGVTLATDGVLVVGLGQVGEDEACRPARDAGLKIGDVIRSVDGRALSGAAELTDAIAGCGGRELTLLLERQGQAMELVLRPVWSTADGEYKSGMWIRDSTAGIGTVTFIEPESGLFGGLGHGICDVDTGQLLPMRSGSICGVELGGIVPGKAGVPGELQGSFTSGRLGALIANTEEGVFGLLTQYPAGIDAGSALPIGLRGEVKEGAAMLLSTDGAGGVAAYDVEISSIDRSGRDTKNFVVEVVDPDLLALTGGIVQGMSGSPLVQDGRLIGAVTHVLINDPTRGYGIFIENMLDAAEN